MTQTNNPRLMEVKDCNIKELRIGNFIGSGKKYEYDESVHPFGFWYKVRSIGNEDCDFEQIETETEESYEWVFKDNWCGIPITKDWLIKFGFEKETDFPWSITKNGFTIDFEDDMGCYVEGGWNRY